MPVVKSHTCAVPSLNALTARSSDGDSCWVKKSASVSTSEETVSTRSPEGLKLALMTPLVWANRLLGRLSSSCCNANRGLVAGYSDTALIPIPASATAVSNSRPALMALSKAPIWLYLSSLRATVPACSKRVPVWAKRWAIWASAVLRSASLALAAASWALTSAAWALASACCWATAAVWALPSASLARVSASSALASACC